MGANGANVKGRKKIKTTLKFCPDDWNTGATKGKTVRGARGRRDDEIGKSFWTRQAHGFEVWGDPPGEGLKRQLDAAVWGAAFRGSGYEANGTSKQWGEEGL